MPSSERTTWEELPDLIEAAFSFCKEQTAAVAPMMLFEPHPAPRFPGNPPTVSDALEALLVVAFEKSIREAVFQALDRVELREPNLPAARSSVKTPKFKDHTPLKSFYRQMAKMPATVFSVTFPDDGTDAISIFFLRTAFTVSEFRREIEQPIG